MRSQNQIERQSHRREDGRYRRTNPCYVCTRSAGVSYFSHHDTDQQFGDELLVLCKKCSKTLAPFNGQEALAKARLMAVPGATFHACDRGVEYYANR